MSSIEIENRALRSQLEIFQVNLASARRDAEYARNSLGPWFHSTEHLSFLAQTQNQRTMLTPRTERATRRRLSVPLTTASFPARDSEDDAAGSDVRAGRSRASTVSGIDDYFGEVPNSSAQTATSPANQQHRSPFPPASNSPPGFGQISSEPYPFPYPTLNSQYYPNDQRPPAFSPNNLPPPSIVYDSQHPATLQSTIQTLQQSIVSLTTSLDSLERRQDLALTTETLRMHEDVASLRAIVHGLRVQVHGVLMERSHANQYQQQFYQWGAGGAARYAQDGAQNAEEGHSPTGSGPSRDPGTSTSTGIIEGPNGSSRPYQNTPYLPITMSIRKTTGTENKL